MPHKGKIYSVNEGNYAGWSNGLKKYIDYLKVSDPESSRPYSLRYIGTAVADIQRTLIYGGIFMYPADSHNPNGKLRLLYELNPLAMIIEQAGGRATDGKNRILEIVPIVVFTSIFEDPSNGSKSNTYFPLGYCCGIAINPSDSSEAITQRCPP